MKLETWVCRPPNVMMFQLQRVTYDKEKQKLVKENSRFDFDQTIYLDLFLNINKEKAEKHQEYLQQTKMDLKVMKDTYQKYAESGSGQSQKITEVFGACEKLINESSSTSEKNEPLTNSVRIDGQDFEFKDPS